MTIDSSAPSSFLLLVDLILELLRSPVISPIENLLIQPFDLFAELRHLLIQHHQAGRDCILHAKLSYSLPPLQVIRHVQGALTAAGSYT